MGHGGLAAFGPTVADDDPIPIDGTELAKPYARRMQYITTIRDASRVGDPLVNGYWCFGVYHWQVEHKCLNPLMLQPWSTRQPLFRSENDLMDRWFWLLDRGGDRPEVFSSLLRVQPRWIVRLREDRPLIGPDGSRRSAGYWADWALANCVHRGQAATVPVYLPLADVPQPEGRRKLWLLVPTYSFFRNGKPDRWVLLTCGRIDQHARNRQVRHEFALRWRAEDSKRLLVCCCWQMPHCCSCGCSASSCQTLGRGSGGRAIMPGRSFFIIRISRSQTWYRAIFRSNPGPNPAGIRGISPPRRGRIGV